LLRLILSFIYVLFFLFSILCLHLSSLFFFFYCSVPHLDLHSFPTRRSSDLLLERTYPSVRIPYPSASPHHSNDYEAVQEYQPVIDRKSTRLNSSHVSISYAVFCLKKKK